VQADFPLKEKAMTHFKVTRSAEFSDTELAPTGSQRPAKEPNLPLTPSTGRPKTEAAPPVAWNEQKLKIRCMTHLNHLFMLTDRRFPPFPGRKAVPRLAGRSRSLMQVLGAVMTLITAGCGTPRVAYIDPSSVRVSRIPGSGVASPDESAGAILTIRSSIPSSRNIQALPDTPKTFKDIRSFRFQFFDAETGLSKQDIVTDNVKASSYKFTNLPAPSTLRVGLFALDGTRGSGNILNSGGNPSLSDIFTISNQSVTKVNITLNLSGGYGPNGDIDLGIKIVDGVNNELPPVDCIALPDSSNSSESIQIGPIKKGIDGFLYWKRAWFSTEITNLSKNSDFNGEIKAEFILDGHIVETKLIKISISPRGTKQINKIKSVTRSTDVALYLNNSSI
jgi:hypothetical protein